MSARGERREREEGDRGKEDREEAEGVQGEESEGAFGERRGKNELGAFGKWRAKNESGAFGDRSESGAFGERRAKNELVAFEERLAGSARLNEKKETEYHASLSTTLAPPLSSWDGLDGKASGDPGTSIAPDGELGMTKCERRKQKNGK